MGIVALQMGLAATPGRAQTSDPQPADSATIAPAAPTDGAPAPVDIVQKRLDFLTSKLGLSEPQQVQILPILKEEELKEEAAFNNQNASSEAATREVRKTARQQISPYLTPEQRETFAHLAPFVKVF